MPLLWSQPSIDFMWRTFFLPSFNYLGKKHGWQGEGATGHSLCG